VYDLLHVLPFDNVRKRSSVIVRKQGEKQITLFMKGAESMVDPIDIHIPIWWSVTSVGVGLSGLSLSSLLLLARSANACTHAPRTTRKAHCTIRSA
jgi:hypothetical protein